MDYHSATGNARYVYLARAGLAVVELLHDMAFLEETLVPADRRPFKGTVVALW